MPRVAIEGRKSFRGKSPAKRFDIPDEASVCTLVLSRDGWPEGECIYAECEISTDGGKTWAGYGVGAHGGTYINRFGGVMPDTTLRFNLPKGTSRIGRVVIDAKTELTSKVDVDLE